MSEPSNPSATPSEQTPVLGETGEPTLVSLIERNRSGKTASLTDSQDTNRTATRSVEAAGALSGQQVGQLSQGPVGAVVFVPYRAAQQHPRLAHRQRLPWVEQPQQWPVGRAEVVGCHPRRPAP